MCKCTYPPPIKIYTHLSFGCSDSCPARINLLIDGGQEVLGDPQSVLQEGEVWVVFRRVFQEVLSQKRNVQMFIQPSCLNSSTFWIPALDF